MEIVEVIESNDNIKILGTLQGNHMYIITICDHDGNEIWNRSIIFIDKQVEKCYEEI